MIDILNLLWIVPLSASIGFLIAALLTANKYAELQNKVMTDCHWR